MRKRLGLVVTVAVLSWFGRAHAQEEGSAEPPPAEEHHEAPAAEPHHDAPAVEHHDAAEHHAEPAVGSIDDDGEVVTDPFDEDGDGVVEPEELADKAEWDADFKDIPAEPDEAALEHRAKDKNLLPSMTVEQFQKLVRIGKKVVLSKMAKKQEAKQAKKMSQFALGIFVISLLGLGLLFMPLGLAKKYPGKSGLLFKYAGLAALTFFVTVNLFGGVLFGLRTVQGALAGLTNPGAAIAGGTFDTLDEHAEEYIVMGKELFAPTIEQMKANPDEPPAALILENGQRLVKDASVFLTVAGMFKQIKFLLDYLPMVLFLVTMLLFFKSIWPTLKEIIQLPARAAEGAATGGDVVKNAMGRVFGEFKAVICTIAVLALLTLLSSVVLGEVVKPAIAALLDYFSLSISYLQFVPDASSTSVFISLFGVILFLVLSLATLIVSMAFFLGKCQKIFQARFNGGVALEHHYRFFTWGVPSVVLVQLFPLLFIFIASRVLLSLNNGITAGVTEADQLPWGKLLVAGPLFLVVAYVALFWALRCLKAITFLFKYKVPPAKP